MKRFFVLAAVVVAVLAGTCVPTEAGGSTATITSFSAISTGNLVFTLGGIGGAQASAPVTSYQFSINFHTSSTAGAILTVTAPTMIGSGSTIPASAFSAQCTPVSDAHAAFTSSGIVQLSGSAVTCGTLAASTNETLTFDVTLTLDSGASAFSSIPSDTYANGTLVVGANLP